MIFEFPKLLNRLGGDYKIIENNQVLMYVDFIKHGIILKNQSKNLIAQIIRDKKGVAISIADSPTLFVNNGYVITDSFIDKKSLKNTDLSKARLSEYEYFTFGNPDNFHYELFRKKKASVFPELMANVINNPLNDDYFKIRTNDSLNILKTLSLVFAITLLC